MKNIFTSFNFSHTKTINKIIFLFLILFFFQNEIVQAQDKKVLFLGNSYTAWNDMPRIFENLAEAGGYEALVDRSTPGGCTLSNPTNGHLYNDISLEKINEEDWDYVILQEQSQYPVIDHWRDNYFYPGAADLDELIKENDSCSQTMMYMTWGRKFGGMQCNSGYCSIDFINFEHMTDSMASSYVGAAESIDASVSPVGLAWKTAFQNDPSIELFDSDGSHPSLEGSYLAACTFYVSIFHKSAEGLDYYDDLNEEMALFLQKIATSTVFDNLDLWNIDTTTLTANFDYESNDQTVEFINNSNGAESYLWAFGDGETDTIENPIHTYEGTGLYSVLLTTYRGDCGMEAYTTFVNIVIDDVVNQDAEKDQIKIFAPLNNSNLLVENNGLKGNYQLKILDTRGKTVYAKDYQMNPGAKYHISKTGWQKGIYILQVSNGARQFQQKFVTR